MRLRLVSPVAAAAVCLVACACGSSARKPSTNSSTPTVDMPAVVGLTQSQALRRFDGVRITVYVYPERNPRIPKGFVFHQTPGPGPVEKGALAAIYVSAGPHGPRVGRSFIGHR